MTTGPTISELQNRIVPGRKVTGIAAALLPFGSDGNIAEQAFADHLRYTQNCGLYNAVNMDTGYVNLLSGSEQRRVLQIASEALGPGVEFYAGAYIEREHGDIVNLYRREMDMIAEFGGTPVLFQTARLHGASAPEKAKAYTEICSGYPRVVGFELGKMFAPNGEIWDDETFARMLEIPTLIGAKHSSLDRMQELKRLETRDRMRPDFCIYTGNDLAIDMIEYGSDYLLGLATFCPRQFAQRDRAWAEGDASTYYRLTDAIQHLGNVAFRAPVPAYKHSAAHYLYLNGRIPTSLTHPGSPQRPDYEIELMQGCSALIS